MKLNGENIEFPAISKISFFKVFESLETMAEDEDKYVSGYARNLLNELSDYGILKEGIEDVEQIDQYTPQVKKISRVLFPDLLQSNEIKALTPPFEFTPFFTSKRLTNLLNNAGDDFKLELNGVDKDLFYVVGCVAILQLYYNYPVKLNRPFILEIPNISSGNKGYYRLALNGDLIEIKPSKKAKEISQKDYLELIDNFHDIALWKEKFPPNSWIMRGIGIMNMMDITMDQSIANITSNLLIKSSDTAIKVGDNLRTLFGISDLRVGMMAMENHSFLQMHKSGTKSILLDEREICSCEESLCGHSYNVLIEHREPMAISDVDEYYKSTKSDLSAHLKKQKLGSYIIAPLQYNDEFLGFIELASPRKNELNSVTLSKLGEVLPILSMAVGRFKEEATNHMEAVIQQECTTIHPSVKWKFEDEAKKYMRMREEGNHAQFQDIVFREIYPLYGQIDIKDSSNIRNQAVVSDLVTQLKNVRSILIEAYRTKELPSFEELVFRINQYLEELTDGLLAGSEYKILGFLQSEIYPIFDHLKSLDNKLTKIIHEYSESLDGELHIIYDERKRFDESVMMVNHAMASFIDKKQVEAQQMFPHYFERYKTDGLEYNMYIGESIVKNKKFDILYLHNLRLWQLMVMCEMENEFKKLQPELQTQLEVASLILVYNTPLSIHFRMDEKKFDVEGAYNARYEIVKKRVDKAYIKGTTERITQPGKIAVIYTSDQDKTEYEKYINFLGAKGYVKHDSLEEYELENVQGITGLKALRVDVNYDQSSQQDTFVKYAELIDSI